jgi:uncharacterized protein (TIGR03086 family)
VDIALLNEASEDFAAYLSEVTDGDLTARTPCALWTIDDLYHHMLELNIRLCQAFDHQSPPPAAPDGYLLRETIYRDSARYTANALAHASDSIPAGRLSAPFGARSAEDAFESHLTNTLVHTWDLAQAIQIDFDLPRPDVLDIALGCLRRIPSDMRGDGKAFATTSDFCSGSAIGEVLLLSGRSPSWRPDQHEDPGSGSRAKQ